ncbi:MAG: hypothetical protein PW734_01005 [Verrucomicrobium sp.]|nr:hypothetical protein [Verrucomicrobium sp.]
MAQEFPPAAEIAGPPPTEKLIRSIRLFDGLNFPPEADGTLQDAQHTAGQVVVYPRVEEGITLPEVFRPRRDELERRLQPFLNKPINPNAARRLARLIQESMESAFQCPVRVTVRTQNGVADCLVTRFNDKLKTADYSVIEVGPQVEDLSFSTSSVAPLPSRGRGEIVVAQPIFDGGPNGTPHEKVTALQVALLQVMDDLHNLQKVSDTVPEKMKDPRLIATYREDRKMINATLGLVRGRLERLDEDFLPGHRHLPEADIGMRGARVERIVITDRPWWDPPRVGKGPIDVDVQGPVSVVTVKELFSPMLDTWYDAQRFRAPLDVLAGIYARSVGKTPSHFIAIIPQQDLRKGQLLINIVPAEEAWMDASPR